MSLMQNLPSRSPYLQRLMIKGAGRIYFRNTSELDWIESDFQLDIVFSYNFKNEQVVSVFSLSVFSLLACAKY